MAKKKDDEKLQKWLARMAIATQYQETQLSKGWMQTLNNYRGLYSTGTSGDEHRVTVDVVKMILGLMVPAIYFRDPSIKITPRRPGTEMECRFTETLLNYYIKELKLKKVIQQSIKDALMFGVAYVKWGFTAQVEEQDLTPVVNPETGEPMADGSGYPLLSDPTGAIFIEEPGGVIPFMDKDGNRIPPGQLKPTQRENVKWQAPFAERWSPFDVLRDPRSLKADLSDAGWVAFRVTAPLEEVKNNPAFIKAKDLVSNTQPDFLKNVREYNKKRLHEINDDDYFTYYEIWCKEYNPKTKSWSLYMKVVADGCDHFLYDDLSPYQIDNFPCSVLAFEEDPESGQPLSLIEAVRSQIQVINVSRTQYTNHRERFNQKMVFNRSAGITDADAKRIAKARYGAFIGVKLEPGVDPRTAIRPLEIPPMDPNVYGDSEIALGDIRRVLGIPEHYLGGQDVARQATQAGYIENALNIRINEKQDIVGDFLVEILRGWKQVLQQYGDFEKEFQITLMGQEMWQNFHVSQNIPDDLDFLVDMYPSTFQSKEQERQEILELLNLTANIPEVNRMVLLERLFRAYGYADPSMLIQPVQPPMLGPDGQPMEPGAEQSMGSLSQGAIDTNSANAALNQGVNAMNAQ